MLEVRHIQKSFKKKQVLADVSFHAECGECIAIVGRNGSGKSTLLQIIAGVLRPDGGEIFCFGKDAGRNKKVIRQYCGYVPQENPLIEELSVRDNLKLWAGKSKELEQKVIKQFQLEDIMTQKVAYLSGGMKRRLSIACAMQQWPPILLLDEPTAALDIYYKEEVGQWIRQYQSMNGIVIMSTHDEMEIRGANRCMMMQDGGLQELPNDGDIMKHIRKMVNR